MIHLLKKHCMLIIISHQIYLVSVLFLGDRPKPGGPDGSVDRSLPGRICGAPPSLARQGWPQIAWAPQPGIVAPQPNNATFKAKCAT